MKKYLLPLLVLLAAPAFAAQQEITVVPDDPVIPSIGSLKDTINLRLADIDENFDEIYPIIEAGPVYVNASAPADTKVVWIDTDQSNAIKVYVGGVWTVVGSGGDGSYTLPTWLPSAAPTADNMIIQATGGCSDSQYTDQSTCEANSGTWTPPVGAWTSIIDGLINDAGTGTDDLLSASEINTRISAAGDFYQVADGDLATAAGADTAGNSKLFGTNASGVVGWYDIPGAGSGIAHATADGKWYGSKDGAWVDLAPTFSSALPKWIDLVVGHNFTTGDLSWYNGQVWKARTTHVKVTGEYPSESSDDWEPFTVDGGGSEPVAMQQVFSSSTTLVAGLGSKTKAITGVGWTTADIGCDISDTLVVSVKTSSTINGTYTEVGTVSLTASSQNTAVDISQWSDISAGTWVRIDLTGAPAAATECTVVIEGVEQ